MYVQLLNLRRRLFAELNINNLFIVPRRNIIYWTENLIYFIRGYLNPWSTSVNSRARIVSFS